MNNSTLFLIMVICFMAYLLHENKRIEISLSPAKFSMEPRPAPIYQIAPAYQPVQTPQNYQQTVTNQAPQNPTHHSADDLINSVNKDKL